MKKKIIIGIIIAVVVVAFIGINIAKSNSGEPAFGGGSGIRVATETVKKGDISSYVSASGVVEEVEKAEGYFDTPLRVEKVSVEKNQKVSKGQKIIDVNLDDLNSQLAQLKITRATQELAIKKLKAGDRKSAMEMSASIAQNNVTTAQNAYNDAVKSYNNSKALLEAGSIPQSQFDSVEKALKDAEITLNNAKLTYQSTVSSNQSSSKSDSVDLETQQQTLKATVLQIEDMEKKIKKINDTLLSPIDGVVSELNVVQGSFVSNAEAAYKIVNPDKLRIKAKVSEFNIKDLTLGQTVQITGDVISKDQKVSGKVISISPTATKNVTNNGEETVIEVLISIDNINSAIKPGVNVDCDIYTVQKKGIVLANLNMLDTDKDDNKFVYLINEKDSIMKKVPVKLGITSDMNAEVLEGLKEGDVVALDPQPTFKDGVKVRIIGGEKK